MIHLKRAISMACTFGALSLTLPAYAISVEDLSISGFGTVAAGITDDNNNFRVTEFDDESLNFTALSKFAVQLTADMSDGLSATAQILATGKDEFNAGFEWAYLSYELNDNTTLRAGRLRIPTFRYSDYLDVGYAYTFVRPPQSVYNFSFSTYEGLSAIYQMPLGDYDISTNLVLGKLDQTFFRDTAPTKGTTDTFAGINVQITRDWFSAYLSYFRTSLTIPVAQIEAAADGLEAAGAPASATSKLRMDGDSGQFLGLGIAVDYEDVLVNFEYTTTTADDSFYLDNEQWYLLLGYRMDNITPYVYYETTETDRNTSTALAFPAPMQPTVQGMLDTQQFEFDGISAGIRYNFHSNAALKVEYNHYRDVVDAVSSFGTNANPETLNVLTVAVDFVF